MPRIPYRAVLPAFALAAVLAAGCGASAAASSPSAAPSSAAPASTAAAASPAAGGPCARFPPVYQEITTATAGNPDPTAAVTASGSQWSDELEAAAGPPSQATQASVDMSQAAAYVSIASLAVTTGSDITADWAEVISALNAARAACAAG